MGTGQVRLLKTWMSVRGSMGVGSDVDGAGLYCLASNWGVGALHIQEGYICINQDYVQGSPLFLCERALSPRYVCATGASLRGS